MGPILFLLGVWASAISVSDHGIALDLCKDRAKAPEHRLLEKTALAG